MNEHHDVWLPLLTGLVAAAVILLSVAWVRIEDLRAENARQDQIIQLYTDAICDLESVPCPTKEAQRG